MNLLLISIAVVFAACVIATEVHDAKVKKAYKTLVFDFPFSDFRRMCFYSTHHFGKELSPDKIADILNEEWYDEHYK